MTKESKALWSERVDDLQRNGLRIIQRPDAFCLSIDAVLLSWFARAGKGERVLDMGCGTGIIPLLMSQKTDGCHFTGLEIQHEAAMMAMRSVALNGLDDKIEIVEGDIKEAGRVFGAASFDVVTANPPYIRDTGGLKNPSEAKAIARHEILCTAKDLMRESAKVLRNGGRFYLVHRPFRLAEIFGIMSESRLAPKRIKFVHPYMGKDANLFLLEAALGGGAWLKVEEPLYVYREPGVYTDEIRKIYSE